MAAALGTSNGFGGDTNGHTDLLCIPACGAFPIAGYDPKSDDYTVLATAGPTGGLVGAGPWKTLSMTFTPTVGCPAVMLGPATTQTTAPGLRGTYVFYDALNLQETSAASGICDANNDCIVSADLDQKTASNIVPASTGARVFTNPPLGDAVEKETSTGAGPGRPSA